MQSSLNILWFCGSLLPNYGYEETVKLNIESLEPPCDTSWELHVFIMTPETSPEPISQRSILKNLWETQPHKIKFPLSTPRKMGIKEFAKYNSTKTGGGGWGWGKARDLWELKNLFTQKLTCVLGGR